MSRVEARYRRRGAALDLVRTLRIQREALGLRHHAIVAEPYPGAAPPGRGPGS